MTKMTTDQVLMYIKIVSIMYQSGLRTLIKAIVDDPDKEWDNILLEILDKIFGYENKEDKPENKKVNIVS